jgi:predicted tellurium resistance membrane protein TerC
VEFLSMDFLVALASIVVIDLVLAGDKAIVIALAARNVPRHLQRRAIVAGTAGAVMFEASVTNRVLELTTLPVEAIAGDAVSSLERYGIPAAIGAGLMLLLAIDD